MGVLKFFLVDEIILPMWCTVVTFDLMWAEQRNVACGEVGSELVAEHWA